MANPLIDLLLPTFPKVKEDEERLMNSKMHYISSNLFN